MAIYKYRALNPQGKQVRGTIEANNANEARARLSGQFNYILSVEMKERQFHPILLAKQITHTLNPQRHTGPKAADKVIFFRQLALMLRAGNTLTQALEIAAEMTDKTALKHASLSMLIKIQAGNSFANALETQGKLFPSIAAKLIATAELSGELQATLERLADNLERGAAVKRQLTSSLAYPSALLVVAFGVFMGLAVGIVPKFAKMLEGRSQDLPGITQAMLNTSSWLIDYGAFLGGGILLTIFLILASYTTPTGKAIIDRVLVNTPVVGTSIQTSTMAQLGWTMSMLLNSGLTVLESLRIIRSVVGNHHLANCFEKAGDEILSGRTLAHGLRQQHIPVMVQHMTGIGERSGELEHVMLEIGKFYHAQAENRIKKMLAMIEPAMTLLIGGMVAFVYIGFFKAMIQVSAG